MIQLVTRQSLEFKILKFSVDFSLIQGLFALTMTYIIIIYQMNENK